MRHVKANEAKARFDTLIEDVERGETITIDRDGKPVARMVPIVHKFEQETRSPDRQAQIERAIANIKAIRERTQPVTVEEILSARNEGRR